MALRYEAVQDEGCQDIFSVSQVTGHQGQSRFSRGMTQLSLGTAATLSQALVHAVWTGLSMLNSFCTVGVYSCLLPLDKKLREKGSQI